MAPSGKTSTACTSTLFSDTPLDQRILTEGTIFTPQEKVLTRGTLRTLLTCWGLTPGIAQDVTWVGPLAGVEAHGTQAKALWGRQGLTSTDIDRGALKPPGSHVEQEKEPTGQAFPDSLSASSKCRGKNGGCRNYRAISLGQTPICTCMQAHIEWSCFFTR